MGWMRHPRTKSEMAQNADPGVSEFVRGARRPSHLPDAWDDIQIPRPRCWKDQRRGRKSWER